MINTYENCISLGWFCGTASAMSMFGLRCFSGPFDWCRATSYQQIIPEVFRRSTCEEVRRGVFDCSKGVDSAHGEE